MKPDRLSDADIDKNKVKYLMPVQEVEMKKSGVWGLLLIGLILAFFFVSACSREEKIEIKKENGVTVVYNPKKPAPPPDFPATLSINEELSLGKGESEESMLLAPAAVDIDQNGNIYVIDRKAVQIKVYDPQGNFVRAIGRRGQGPGEFQTIWSFQVTPQQTIFVCDHSSRRIMFFSLDGQLIRELSAAMMGMFFNGEVDPRGDIVGSHTIMDQEARTELIKFNSSLEPLFTVASVPIARYPVFNPYFPNIYFGLTGDGNILWGITTEYVFNVVNPEGKIIKKIVKKYDPEKFTRDDQEKRAKELWGEEEPPDIRVEWPENFPAFQDFVMDERGWLYVRPYTKEKVEKGVIYDVFDAEGRYVARVALPDRAMAVKYGKLYTIEEDEEGMRLVKRYALEW